MSARLSDDVASCGVKFRVPPLGLLPVADDACTDTTESTQASSRAGIDTPFAQELLTILESKLQAHKDEMQSLLEQRCATLDERLDRLEALQQERCNDVAEALLSESERWRSFSQQLEEELGSESDRWRSFSQQLEEELGVGTARLYGVENKLWQLERVFHENRGAQPQNSEASSHTEPHALERLQEHIESNSEFVRSFIERESAKIALLSERLIRSEEERLALERKLEDVARSVEDVRLDTLPTGRAVSSQPMTKSSGSASTSCLIAPSGSGDVDAPSGSVASRRQRPPVTRTSSARAGDLLAAERVRRLSSAPVFAPLGSSRSAQNALPSQATRSPCGSSVAEKCRLPEKTDGQKVKSAPTHASKFPASTVGAQSPTSMKRRVSPRPGARVGF